MQKNVALRAGRILCKNQNGIEQYSIRDKPIIAAQHDLMGGADFWSLKPVLLEGDIAGVRARRILARLIASEQSARTAGVVEVPAGPAVIAE
jgi:vanillate O-demethylase monooxygenase subunit